MLLLCAAATPLRSEAQACVDYAQSLRFVTSLPLDGHVAHVSVWEHTAFVVADSGVVYAVDVSIPGSPTLSGALDLPVHRVTDVAASGAMIYVVTPAFDDIRLLVVDGSNPASLQVRGETAITEPALDLVAAGTRVFAIGGTRVSEYDVSDPEHPALLSELPLKGDRAAFADGRLFVSSLQLYAVDVSVPGHMALVDSVASPAYETTLTVANGILLAGSYGGSVDAYDTHLAHLSATHLAHTPWSIAGDGAVAAVGLSLVEETSESWGVQLLDVSDASAPVLLGAATGTMAPGGVAMSGGFVFAADGPDLAVFDARSHDSVGSADHVLAGEGFAHVRLVDDNMYAVGMGHSFDDERLRIYDVSDPHAPVLRGTVGIHSLFGPGILAVSGSIALVVREDWLPSVAVIDVSDPSAPESLAVLVPNAEGISAVATDGTLAAIGSDEGANAGGVHLWDLTAPSQPVDLGLVGPSAPVSACTFVGHYLVVAYGTADMRVFDLGSDGFPLVAVLGLAGAARDLHVVGSVLYSAESVSSYDFAAHDGLELVDVTDPASPAVVGGLSLHNERSVFARPTVDIADGFAYVTDGVTNLWVVDARDAQAPALMGQAGAFLGCTTAFVSGDAVCCVGGNDGVYLFPRQCIVPTSSDTVDATYGPAGVQVHGDGRLRLALARASDVAIAVYDPQGRRVHSITTTLGSGPHVIHWDRPATPLASGLYFLRITAGRTAYTVRSPLLR